ncbi:MAG: hypothetical protein Q7J10_00735 [Methanosarcinaceae archaeon]|nr:hypothetical protein [Methanosarcinaceae archaeon]
MNFFNLSKDRGMKMRRTEHFCPIYSVTELLNISALPFKPILHKSPYSYQFGLICKAMQGKEHILLAPQPRTDRKYETFYYLLGEINHGKKYSPQRAQRTQRVVVFSLCPPVVFRTIPENNKKSQKENQKY